MIRQATNKDIEQINILGEQLHHNFTKTYHIETEIDNKMAIVLVAEKSDIVGYLYAIDLEDNIDLLSIFVDENSRYQHIGTDLIEKLKSLSKDKTITLEVSSKNDAAIALYKKNDFKEVGIRKNYYENSDAIIMKWGN